MKARKKNSNDKWAEIKYVQLDNSDILYKSENLEFDAINAEPETISQITNEPHWQEVRERAAIAAMQGTITILGSSDRYAFKDIVVQRYKGKQRTYPNEIAQFAVDCADALIEELKNK